MTKTTKNNGTLGNDKLPGVFFVETYAVEI